MAKISFLGLGQMGRPISTRLLRAGHHVTVWDRTPSAMTPLVELGATAVGSAAAAGAGVDVAITMVPTPEAVDQILFGPDGLAEALGPGQIYVDMSTIGPAAFRSIASRLPEGVQGVDAPVRGSVPEATAARSSSSSVLRTTPSSESGRSSRPWATSTTSAGRARERR